MSRWTVGVAGLLLGLGGLGGGAWLRAEPVGSPSSVLKKGQWSMGLNGGAVGDRAMEGQAEARLYHLGHSRGYGLTDWLSVYGKIGWAHVEIDDPTIIKVNDVSAKNGFGENLLVSVQLKGRIWRHAPSGLEWDGSVQYVDIRRRHKNKNELRWHEWQAATSVAKAFGRLKPYLGVKASLVDIAYKVRQSGALLRQDRYQQDQPFGVFVGSDVSFGEGEAVTLNVEGAYQDGVEVSMALSYVF